MKYLLKGILVLALLTGCIGPKKFNAFLEENKDYVSEKDYEESENIKIHYDFEDEGLFVENVKKKCLPLLLYWETQNIMNYSLDSSYYKNAIYNGLHRGIEEMRENYDFKRVEFSFQKLTQKFQYYLDDRMYYYLMGAVVTSSRSDLPINDEELNNIVIVELELNNGEVLIFDIEAPFKLKPENISHYETRAKYSIETMVSNYEMQMEDVAYRMVKSLEKRL